MSTRWMHRLTTLAMAATLALTLAAKAQTPTAPVNDHDTTRAELDRFDDFMDHHPGIAKDVRNNPSLLTNRDYLEDHKELADFLEDHPGVREEVRENPKAFMAKERRFEAKGGDIDRGELARADQFFDSHPKVYNELKKNPRLVDDPNYLAKHPELQEFLQTHPEIRSDIKSHPKVFMAKERKYEKNEEKAENHYVPRKKR